MYYQKEQTFKWRWFFSIAEELSAKENISEGVIGISNAPQWRLSFSNVVKKNKKAKKVELIKPNDKYY